MSEEKEYCKQCGKELAPQETDSVCDDCYDEIYRDELNESNYEQQRLKE